MDTVKLFIAEEFVQQFPLEGHITRGEIEKVSSLGDSPCLRT